jgi:hypothetical protein
MLTLVTGHKGVDLHAATARRVMQDRLQGGDRLADLRRCAFHVFGGALARPGLAVPAVEDVLATGRYFNPNKHHYGCFASPVDFTWEQGDGQPLPAGWPGGATASDRGAAAASLWDDLLGGAAPAGCTSVDVAAWARGQAGAVVSGTVWRLVVRGEAASAAATGAALAVARGGRDGLLVNPHMECWLVSAGGTGA